jgi:NAD(P)-dependent dehydrogenase (short-subunit alcohol dehydrogenase family)
MDDGLQAVAVTGITGTLGRALWPLLAERGYKVVGCSLREVDEYGVVAVDVRDPFAVGQWFNSLALAGVNLHALVTCAGVAWISPLVKQDHSSFHHVMKTNVNGTWYCVKEAVRHGVKRIVTVSSILGGAPIGYPDRCAYTTSKAAVVGLTRALAVELAPQGVTVNCVVPGHFSLMASKAKGLLEGALGRSPQGQLVTAEEVAQVIAWLVAEAPAAVNGAVLTVDGGYSLAAYPVARWWEE